MQWARESEITREKWYTTNVKIVDFLRFVVIVAVDGNIVVAVAVASSVFFMVLPVCFVLCSLFWFHSHLGLDELLFII